MNSLCIQTISDWCNHSFKIFCDIQIFIEFCNFYQQFIYNFADIAQFLHSFLHDLVDNFCIVYFDDIFVFLKFEEKYYQHLQLIIECLWHTELYVNFKKYEFFKSEIEYLDFLINKNDLCMNLSHIQTISDWCNYSFKIFHDIQIFIEFCNFYWQFIYNFANIAWFLHLLLHDMKRDRKFSLIADK